MKYDKIIYTASDSFYKTRLWNEIAKQIKILVITGKRGIDRNPDFYREPGFFEHCFVEGGFIRIFISIRELVCKNKYKELILSGWDNLFCWIAAFLSPRKKNSCLVESSIYELKDNKIMMLLKRIYVSRISKMYVSGLPQEELVRALGYKGKVIKFGGCGILNYLPQPPFEKRKEVKNFLFVGRLDPVKNLEVLVETFNELPQFDLTIVGFGVLEKKLKSIAKGNITFTGAIKNEDLPPIYSNHDVFILPSLIEPWGLVVEEALNNGIPVIVSNHVGCKDDLVSENTGMVFKLEEDSSLKNAIITISDVNYYNQLRLGVSKLNFIERGNRQVAAFLN